jgi:carbon monoxide dehydrogenase subunit G
MVINASAGQAWALLTDLERVAAIMPGATLDKAEGDDFTGTMSVKVGPIAVRYRGVARIQEMDAPGYRAVISARGADDSGQGQVHTTITARLTPEGERTRVLVDSDINISGRLAQFGRGALADVSARLMAEFVRNLDATLAERPSAPGAPAPGGPTAPAPGVPAPGVPAPGVPAPAVPVPASAAGQPAGIDLGRILVPVLAKRAVPVLAGAVVGALVMRWFTRRDGRAMVRAVRSPAHPRWSQP